jgi:hypothetical protein
MDRLYHVNAQRIRMARERYDRLVAKFDKDRFSSNPSAAGETLDHENAHDHDAANRETTYGSLDPLSMLVKQAEARQEQDAKDFEVQKAFSSVRDMRDIVLSKEIVIVVNKDLNRLPDYHASCFRSRANWRYHTENQGNETDFDTARKERNECLLQMLHVYGKEHLQPGYQQGMDEIFSYSMLAIEMDLFDAETSLRSDRCGLISAEHLLHDSFTLAEAILAHIVSAFGVSDGTNDGPVEKMGESILHKIQYVARDKQLYTHVQSAEWCLSLYTARWVRLLFAREVDGWRNTLLLWDIFFDCISTATAITSMEPTKYTRPGVTPPLRVGDFDLMVVLEMTAASLLWMRREDLLRHRADDGLQALTAMDPLKEVGPLISILLSSLRRFQISSNMAPLLHPDAKEAMQSNKHSVQTLLSNSREAFTRRLSGTRESINLHALTSSFQTDFASPQAIKSLFKKADGHRQFAIRRSASISNLQGLAEPPQSYCEMPTDARRSRRRHSAVDIRRIGATLEFGFGSRTEGVHSVKQAISPLEADITAMEAMDADDHILVAATLLDQKPLPLLDTSDHVNDCLEAMYQMKFTPGASVIRENQNSPSEISYTIALNYRKGNCEADTASYMSPFSKHLVSPATPMNGASETVRKTMDFLLRSASPSDLSEGSLFDS